jgi:hypothetical protein
MANLIQIKRSTTNTSPAALTAGELAYSYANSSNSLFVGNTALGGPIRIAGGNYVFLHQANTAGALTANAVVIVNGNSFITNWKTNSLTIGVDGETVAISNISTFANSTQLGLSANGANTELVTSWAVKTYIDGNAPRLPNTFVAFGANSVANGGSSGFTFDSTNLILSIGNTTVNTQISQTAITTTATIASGNTTLTGFLNVSSYGTFGGAVNAASLNVSGLVAAGNTTITGFINVSSYGTYGGVVNATSFNSTGAATSTFANNVTVTGVTNTVSFNQTGATLSTFANSVTVTGVTNTVSFNQTGATTSTFANNLTVTGVTNTSSLNVSGVIGAGNTTVTGFVDVSSYGTFGGTVNAAALNVSGAAATGNLSVTGTIGSGNTTVTGFVNVSTYGTFGGTVNAAALNVSGLVTTGNTTTTGFINVSSYGTYGGVVNATSFNSTGAATSTFANNVTVTGTANVLSLNVSGDANISGNLYITGNLVSFNVSTLSINDPLLFLASNNFVSDILDIGFVGAYGPDGNTANHRHTGLFRDATDGVWKLFSGLAAEPTTTVDTSNATFTIATLQSYLSTGGAAATGLIANATTIAITANSTLNVAIVANTLTLSTALGGTSGGTGLASFTTEDLLVANSSNGFRKLNVGTEGYVLQVASGVVAWNTLDGGSF